MKFYILGSLCSLVLVNIWLQQNFFKTANSSWTLLLSYIHGLYLGSQSIKEQNVYVLPSFLSSILTFLFLIFFLQPLIYLFLSFLFFLTQHLLPNPFLFSSSRKPFLLLFYFFCTWISSPVVFVFHREFVPMAFMGSLLENYGQNN